MASLLSRLTGSSYSAVHSPLGGLGAAIGWGQGCPETLPLAFQELKRVVTAIQSCLSSREAPVTLTRRSPLVLPGYSLVTHIPAGARDIQIVSEEVCGRAGCVCGARAARRAADLHGVRCTGCG